jgi:hypothetical protein
MDSAHTPSGAFEITQWGSSVSSFPNTPPTLYMEQYSYTQLGDAAVKQLLVFRGSTIGLTGAFDFHLEWAPQHTSNVQADGFMRPQSSLPSRATWAQAGSRQRAS